MATEQAAQHVVLEMPPSRAPPSFAEAQSEMPAADLPVNPPVAATGIDKLVLRLGFAAFAMAFVLPGHYPPWMSFEPQLLAAFGFACVLPVAFKRALQPRLKPGLLGGASLALIPLPLLQLAGGQVHFVSDAVLPALYLGGLALCIIGARNAGPQTKIELTDLLFIALTGAAGLSAAMAWSQWLQQYPIPMTNPSPPGERVYANLGQPNHLATLLALGCVGTLWAHARGVFGGGTTALVIACFGSAMLMTQSRTGWLAVVLICAWMWISRRGFSRPVGPKALLLWLAVFASLFMAWQPLNDALFPVPDTLADRLSGAKRLLHWTTLWDAALERPWLGYGWNQVGLAQLATAVGHAPTGEMLTNSHNTALDLVLWCGLPIGLTIVALVLAWIVRMLSAGLDERQSFVMLVFLLIGMHALVEFPLDHTYFLLPWGLAIGLIDEPGQSAKEASLPRATVFSLYAAIALTASWVVAEYIQVDAATREVRMALLAGSNRTTTLPPPPGVALLDAPRELHRLAITQARADMPAAELEWMMTVTNRFPTPPLLLRDALAAGLNRQPERALLRLSQLCAIHKPVRCQEAQAEWTALSKRHELPQPPSWPTTGRLPAR